MSQTHSLSESESMIMKIVIHRNEYPELFEQMQNIRNCQLRSRSLKQFAQQGLSLMKGKVQNVVVLEQTRIIPSNPQITPIKERNGITLNGNVDVLENPPMLNFSLADMGFEM